MSEVKRAGGCMCGAIRFRALGEPNRVGICHCTTCQQSSGSAFHVFAVYPRDKVDLEGEPTAFVAARVQRLFCPKCGSSIGSLDEAGEIDITLGLFDKQPDFRPDYELFIESRAHWLPQIEGVSRHAEHRDGVQYD